MNDRKAVVAARTEFNRARQKLSDLTHQLRELNWDVIRGSNQADPLINHFIDALIKPTLDDFVRYVDDRHLLDGQNPELVLVERLTGERIRELLGDLSKYRAGTWPADAGDNERTHREKQLTALLGRVSEIRASLEPLGVIWRVELATGLSHLTAITAKIDEDAMALSTLRGDISGLKTAIESAAKTAEEARQEAARAQLEALTTKLTDTEKALKERTDAVKTLEERLAATLKEAEDLAKVAKMKVVSRHYGRTAESYGRQAAAWIVGALGVASVMLELIRVIILYGPGPPAPEQPITVAANVSHFSVRALLVSVLSFALVMCVRNYRAAKHNQATNRHRSEALSTFEHLAKIGDEEMKKILFTQATLAIFTAQPTGYSEPGTGSTHVAELIAATGLGKGGDGGGKP